MQSFRPQGCQGHDGGGFYRSRTRPFVGSIALSLSLCGGIARADLTTVGEGKKMVLVRAQFPRRQLAAYDLFVVKCTKCHAMRRPIRALRTGITPVTGSVFERGGIKAYVVKMMRKEDSEIGRGDAKILARFLISARSLAKK